MNYYNEFEPKAAAWLRELIKDGLIPAGDVDTRSITEVQPHEIQKYTQCHFFAGIGGWSLALELAGWPADRPVWTGSCPCQPFSAAGKRQGTADKRHLWPHLARLIAQRRPPVVIGEQVASKDGRHWLAGVRTDLEGMAYAVGAADLCAAGAEPEVAGWIDLGDGEGRIPVSAGPPHIRQRLYWVAQSESQGRPRVESERAAGECLGAWVGGGSSDGRMAESDGRDTGPERQQRGGEHGQQPQDGGARGGVGDAEQSGLEGHAGYGDDRSKSGRLLAGAERPTAASGRVGFWDAYDLIPCRDGKSRRVEPGSFPLAHGIPGRVGLLRGYGNAIVPPLDAEFIQAFLDTLQG